MKKTLFACALLGAMGLAMGQESLDDTISLTFSSAATEDEGYVSTGYGLAFTVGNDLDTSRVTTTATLDGETLSQVPDFSTVQLQSITLKVYGNNWSNSTFGGTTAYIADNATKTVVAHSTSNVSGAAGSLLTFDFENVTLDSGSTYLLVFMNGTSTMPSVGDSALASNGNIWANGRGFATIGDGLDTASSSELGFITNQGVPMSNAFSPIVTIQATTTASVPEPATATLSLLALAGLAARRRRA